MENVFDVTIREVDCVVDYKSTELRRLMAQLAKKHKSAIVYAAELPAAETVGTGSAQLDHALGAGWPVGKISEITGSEATGKTLLCLSTVAAVQIQARSTVTLWIDADYGFDPRVAATMGVDATRVIVVRPRTAQQAYASLYDTLSSDLSEDVIKLAILDSLSALTPEDEAIESGINQAGLNARALRALLPVLGRSRTALLVTTQVRSLAGLPQGPRAIGGRALRHYASIRVQSHEARPMTDQGVFKGLRLQLEVLKSKVGGVCQTCEAELRTGLAVNVVSLSDSGSHDSVLGFLEQKIDAI